VIALCVAVVIMASAGCDVGPLQSIRSVTVVVPDRPPVAVMLPARLERIGAVPNHRTTYRLDAKVEVRPDFVDRDLVLVLPSLSAQARAHANGEALIALRSGDPTAYRVRAPLAWAVPARLSRSGHLDVSITVEHTYGQSAWITVAPELVPAGMGLGHGTWVERVNLPAAAAGLVVIVSIGLLMIWIARLDRRRRVTSRYFAVQALTAAIYPAQVVGLTLPLGRFEIPVMTSLLVVAITVGYYYTMAFFNRPPPSRWWVVVAGSIVAAIWGWSGPFEASQIGTPLAVGYLAVSLAAILAQVVRITRSGQQRRAALLYLGAWATLAISAPADFLAWTGLADPFGGAKLAVLAFFLFPLVLELLLNQQHIGSLADANTRLAGQVDDLERHRGEIEQLNLELRRQIADRAAQLHAALLLSHRGATVAPTLTPGEVVQERYRVVRPLGAGGMGTVYEVERLTDSRRLALKLAREVNGEALARMAREAQTASTVTHPNVVAMVDVDVSSAGFLYLVMELVDGTSLSLVRERFGDKTFAVPVLAQLAAGLAALHEKSVLHRDLKPANVLLTRGDDGRPLVKISDFGIALVPEPSTGAGSGVPAIQRRRAPSARGTHGVAAPAAMPSPGRASEAGVDPTTPLGFCAMAPSRTTGPVTGAAAGSATGPASGRETRPAAGAAAEGDNATVPSPNPPRLPPGPRALPTPVPAGSGRRQRREAAGSESGAGLTRTGFLPGTPAYMAPELAEGREHLSLAADLFAFGVIARELLVNKRPFLEPPLAMRLEGRRPEPAPPLDSLWPEAPAELASLLDRCLDFDPSVRPTASVLAATLSRAAEATDLVETVLGSRRPTTADVIADDLNERSTVDE
jgi:serine/threonine-protein kinase